MLTVGDLVDLFLSDLRARGKKSADSLKYTVRHVCRVLGEDRDASSLKSSDIRAYMARRLGDEGAARSSVNKEVWALRKGFKLAYEDDLIDANAVPRRWPRFESDPNAVRQGFVLPDQFLAIFRHLNSDVADFAAFLFASGWRRGEAAGLTWDCLSESDIRLRDSKNRRPRVIPIAGALVPIVNRRRWRALGPYVFHQRGKPIGNAGKAFRTACVAAGLPPRLIHDLRRSAIKNMVECGIDQKTCMAFSGHTTISTFLRYQMVDQRRMVEASELAGAWLPRS